MEYPPPCCEDGLPESPDMDQDNMAAIAKALAHPARLHIIGLFRQARPLMVQEIVAGSELAQSTISEHLRILREAGVLFARKDGRRTWYCLRRSILRHFVWAVDGLTDVALPIGTNDPIVDRRSTSIMTL